MAILAVSDLHAHVCSMPHCLYIRHMYSDVTAGAHAQDGAHQISSSTQAELQACSWLLPAGRIGRLACDGEGL